MNDTDPPESEALDFYGRPCQVDLDASSVYGASRTNRLQGYAASLARAFTPPGRDAPRRPKKKPVSISVQHITRIALILVGQRRDVLRDAWRSDFIDGDGWQLPLRKQIHHAVGYMIAALKFRVVNDLGGFLGRKLDAALVSRAYTSIAATFILCIPFAMILHHDGVYGLIDHAESIAVMVGAVITGIHGLRKWRGVQLAKKGKTSDPE